MPEISINLIEVVFGSIKLKLILIICCAGFGYVKAVCIIFCGSGNETGFQWAFNSVINELPPVNIYCLL